MAKRKTISPKTRFEVFKRDAFTCQYCGASAPETVLRVDHIHPVSKGGDNDLMNLITSCFRCNSGKSDVLLSDDSVIQKQRAMLEELNERRTQLEMMLKWREGLKNMAQQSVDIAHEAWSKKACGWSLNENGQKELTQLLKRIPLGIVLDAIESAGDRYLQKDDDGKFTSESVNSAWHKVGIIAKGLMLPPDIRQLHYIRGICKNRFHYINMPQCLSILKEAYEAGVSISTLTEIAKDSKNWSSWCDSVRWAVEDAS